MTVAFRSSFTPTSTAWRSRWMQQREKGSTWNRLLANWRLAGQRPLWNCRHASTRCNGACMLPCLSVSALEFNRPAPVGVDTFFVHPTSNQQRLGCKHFHSTSTEDPLVKRYICLRGTFESIMDVENLATVAASCEPRKMAGVLCV